MSDVQYLFVFIALAGIGLGFGFYSVYAKRKTRRLCDQGLALAADGRPDEALKLLLNAESNWKLNSHDGSRKSHLQDLENLSLIADGIFKLAPLSKDNFADQFTAMIGETRSFITDRSNYRIDGRMMPPEKAQRWVELANRLESLRKELRTCINLNRERT